MLAGVLMLVLGKISCLSSADESEPGELVSVTCWLDKEALTEAAEAN